MKKHSADQLGLGFSVQEMTRVPQSDWKMPELSELPDRLHGLVGVDTETCDYGLAEGKGAGWGWSGGGFVAGYSICADNFRGYLPVGHAEGPNLPRSNVRRWLNHVLGNERQTKVYAHAMYDIGWADRDGVKIRGPAIDVQWTEALLDEYRREYSLESIARDRLGRGKDEAMLREAAKAYGVDPKGGLWKMPAMYAGPYATEDAVLPRDIWAVHAPLIEAEKLRPVMDLEHALLPMYLDMRKRGVRIDVDYAENLLKELRRDIAGMLKELRRRVGFEVQPWAAKSIARALDAEGLSYGTTRTNQPSITKGLLERYDHWLPRAILRIREMDKLAGTFMEGQVLGQCHAGRVHGQVHPLKSDDGGTVTGRLAMSDPNLQFIPTRTEEGAKVRRCFIPEDGETWGKADVSQQEPRLTVHFAYKCKVLGATEARERYIADPNMSYHVFTAELSGLEYKAAKILNLAIIYGRGTKETAAELGKSVEETKEMFAKHNAELPFARALSEVCQNVVNRRGVIRSLMGRRARFPFWEPRRWDDRDGRMLLLDEARKAWPGQVLTRARIHKALNSLIQPSAADQTKKAMLDVWNAGYGKHILIQVHDELDGSYPDKKIGREVGEIMKNAVKLEVPVKVDVDFGPNWRDAKGG